MNTEADSLQVIGVGLGRTGTTSLKAALQMLYHQPCYHMTSVLFEHPDHAKLWTELYRTVESDPNATLPEDAVKRIFKGYANSTDHPACSIYKQLMQIYPKAKIILTVRDANAWIESVRCTVGPRKPFFDSSWYGRLMERLALPAGFLPMTQLSWQLALGHTVDVPDEQMMESFARWNAEIQQTVPPERLLVFNVKEGWAPLCRFLGKPIPDQPFPHVNERKELNEKINRMKRKAIVLGILSASSAALIMALTLKWISNYMFLA